MFDSLVESGSHKEEFARKGSFFLGTFALYAVVLLAAGVGSIYLYDAHLDSQTLELTTLVAPVPVQDVQPEQPKEQPKPVAQPKQEVATRTELIASAADPTKVPEKPATVAAKVPPVLPGMRVVKGTTNYTPPSGGPTGPVTTGTGGAPRVEVDEPPPPPPPKPKPKTIISGGVLNGKAISKPQPPYPPIA